MPTPTIAPNCTSIGKYWTTLEENVLAIQSYKTDLGYLALVISNNEFLDSNGNTSFEESTNPDLTLLNPTEVVSTRLSAENDTVLPYTAVATIRSFIFAQQEYSKFKTTKVAIYNLILHSIDENCIKVLKNIR